MTEVIDKLANRNNREEGDYFQDGILMCGKCHTPKQIKKTLPGLGEKLLPITCQCEEEQAAKAKEAAKMQDFQTMMDGLQKRYGISDSLYGAYTFARDDRRDRKVSDACRRYTASWEAMKTNNIGILFYGSVGTGKSFLAACIVNELLSMCVPATVTSFPRLLNVLQQAEDKQKIIDSLRSYHLLVIDDLGVERDSSYAMEQIFAVIDARTRSGLPLIVTTNLSMEELKNSATIQLKRIYDRIIDACPITLRIMGESRRAGNAESRKRLARAILKGEYDQ